MEYYYFTICSINMLLENEDFAVRANTLSLKQKKVKLIMFPIIDTQKERRVSMRLLTESR